jgi:hypothetical protein
MTPAPFAQLAPYADIAEQGEVVDELTAPGVFRGSTANRLLVRVVTKLATTEQFLRSIEWGIPDSPVGFCIWCGSFWQTGHTKYCALAKALRTSAPIEGLDRAVSEISILQQMIKMGTITMYMDGIERELADTKMILDRIQAKIDQI